MTRVIVTKCDGPSCDNRLTSVTEGAIAGSMRYHRWLEVVDYQYTTPGTFHFCSKECVRNAMAVAMKGAGTDEK